MSASPSSSPTRNGKTNIPQTPALGGGGPGFNFFPDDSGNASFAEGQAAATGTAKGEDRSMDTSLLGLNGGNMLGNNMLGNDMIQQQQNTGMMNQSLLGLDGGLMSQQEIDGNVSQDIMIDGNN